MKRNSVISMLIAVFFQVCIVSSASADSIYYYEGKQELPVTIYGGKSILSGDKSNSNIASDGTITVTNALSSDTRYLFKTCSWGGANSKNYVPWTPDNYKDSVIKMDITLEDPSIKDIRLNLGMAREIYYGEINYKGNSRAYSKTVQLSDYLDSSTQTQSIAIPFEEFGEYMESLYGGTFRWSWAEKVSENASSLSNVYGNTATTVECINGIEFVLPSGTTAGARIENIRIQPREKRGMEGEGIKAGTIGDDGKCRVGFGLFNENGEEVKAIVPNSSVKLNMIAVNDKNENESFLYMMAVYKDGILTELIPAAGDAAEGVTFLESEAYTLPEDVTGFSIMGYIWSDFAERQPYLDFVEVSAE